MRRRLWPTGVLLLAGLVATLGFLRADSVSGGFLRDGAFNLDVNCKIGCSGSGGGSIPTSPPAPQTGVTPPPQVGLTQAFNACLYTTTAWSVTAGDYYPCSIDANGNLRVTNTPTGTQSVSLAAAVDVVGHSGASFDNASGVAAVANGIQGACVFNSTLTAVSAGQTALNQCDSVGSQLMVTCKSGQTSPVCANVLSSSDGVALGNGMTVEAQQYGWNGSSSDRLRDTNKELQVTVGGSTLTQIPSGTNDSSCTAVFAGSVNLHRIWSAASGETATVKFFVNATCTAAGQIWQGIPTSVPSTNDFGGITLPMLYVETSAALTNNFNVTTN